MSDRTRAVTATGRQGVDPVCDRDGGWENAGDASPREDQRPRLSSSSFGLPCPRCGHRQTSVLDTRTRTYDGRRKLDHRIARRRKCGKCHTRFSTEERYRDIEPADGAQPTIADRLRELAAELDPPPY